MYEFSPNTLTQLAQGPQVASSAVVIMPPKELWGPFVDIKKNHMNPKIKRPPYPHITLLAPFVPLKDFPEAAKILRAHLQNVEPFTISFNNFQLFRNKGSSTLYLEPEESRLNALQDLFQTISTLFPNSHRNSFEPHIGVGFFKDAKEAQFLQKKYQQTWTPLAFQIKEIYLLSRDTQESPWEVKEIVCLGKEETKSFISKGETTDS